MKVFWERSHSSGIWSGLEPKAEAVYLGMSLIKCSDTQDEKNLFEKDPFIFSLASHPTVSWMNRFYQLLQIPTPSRTQLLAWRADLIPVFFVLPFTGSWTSPQTDSEGKGLNVENSSKENVPTQHA